MNIIEMLNAIKESEKAQVIFSEILVEMIKNDVDLKIALTGFLLNDIEFGVSCEEVFDYSYTGQRIAFSIDGNTVASDSFRISND